MAGSYTAGSTRTLYGSLALCLLLKYLLIPSWSVLTILFGCFAIFFLFIKGHLSWIIQKPLIFLGTISYSLYLIHQYIGYIIIHRLQELGVHPLGLFVIPIVAVLLLASLITLAVEKPAMTFIRQAYKERAWIGFKMNWAHFWGFVLKYSLILGIPSYIVMQII